VKFFVEDLKSEVEHARTDSWWLAWTNGELSVRTAGDVLDVLRIVLRSFVVSFEETIFAGN
jgi:hypothetical protein